MDGLYQTQRIKDLKDKMLSEPRYASIEQALIITKTYQENKDDPRIIQRAKSLKAALEQMEIRVEPDELIVGNRTAGVRYGVVFPESGSTWVDKEFETLPTRPQDRFNVHQEDIETFRKVIKPYWEGKEYSYFSHKKCEYFPCHKGVDPENFNCLFCYCPLYALGDKCGGNFHFTESGIKDCTACKLPHRRENYGYITGKYQELADMIRKQRENSQADEKR